MIIYINIKNHMNIYFAYINGYFTHIRDAVRKQQLIMTHSFPVEEFHFPTTPFRYRTIKNLHHFHDLLKQQTATLRRDVRFQSTLIPNPDGSQTLNIICKQCQAYFKYMSPHKGQNFYLKDYSQKHQHVLKQTQNFHQSIIQRIENFLAQDSRQDKQELCVDICSNYRITNKQFEQLYSQAAERMKRNTLLYDGKEIDELIRKLKTQRYTVLDDSVESKVEREKKKITKSIVIFNEQMSANYKRYGECCYIALDDRHQLNRWFVGAFVGVGRDMELTLFSLFLMKAVDVDHLKGLIRMFLNSVEVKPLTIITQLAYYYESALHELKQQKFIQSEHLLDHATFSDKLHQKNSKYKRIFAQLYSEPDKRVFFQKLGDLYRGDSFVELDLDLQELVRLADRVCLSQIPRVPVGPYRAIKNKVTQKKSDYSVLRQFPKILYERQCFIGKHLYGKIKNLLTLLLTPPSDDIADKSRIMDIVPELKVVQPHVSKNVMEYLIGKCLSTLHLRVQKVDNLNYKVFNGRKDYLKVTRKNQKEPWACQCQESVKTKLPCIHQLCVCIRFSYSIQIQIGKRWTNEVQRIEQQTRRKMHKKNKWQKTTLSQFLA